MSIRCPVKGSLENHEDLEWLLAWIASRPGGRVEFRRDDELEGVEFRADADGLGLSWFGFEIVHAGACRARRAESLDGWWVGLN